MNAQQRLIRKAIYAVVALPMIIGLVFLSSPATPSNSGGKLARMRKEHNLGQASMGEIDAASETIKLSTLGMRGIAAMTLWWQANEFKGHENWGEYEHKLEQIEKIMPNFVAVWRNQAWNLSYNVSAEFDDYRDKYYWVERGIDCLKKGQRFNQHEPRILTDLGWFHCHKIGEAEEKVQYRRMFYRKYQKDNWQVGKTWHLQAQEMVDHSKKRSVIGVNSTVFHSRPAIAQVHYAEALIDDGIRLDSQTASLPQLRKSQIDRKIYIDRIVMSWKAAWQDADRDWVSGPSPLSQRLFSDSRGLTVSLGGLQKEIDRLGKTNRKLYDINPKAADRLLDKVRERLLAEELKALNRSAENRKDDDKRLIGGALARLRLALKLADTVEGDARAEARRLVSDAAIAAYKINAIEHKRELVNYDHWVVRCKAETTEQALAARRSIDLARRARRHGRLLPAKGLYEKGFDAFVELFKNYPEVREDPSLGYDLVQTCVEYQKLIVRQLDEDFPKNFNLLPMIKEYDIDGSFPTNLDSPTPSEATRE